MSSPETFDQQVSTQEKPEQQARPAFDIDALRKAQQDFEQTQAEQRRQEEERAAEEARTAQTMAKYADLSRRREQLMTELQQTGFDPSASEKNKQEIAALQEAKSKADAEVEESQQSHTAAEATVREIQSIISPGSQPSEEVSNALTQAIAAATKARSELLSKQQAAEQIANQITQAESREVVNPDQAKLFEELKAVEAEATEYYQNPEVQALVQGRAETENNIRKQFIENATRAVEYNGYATTATIPGRAEAIEKVINQFVNEESKQGDLSDLDKEGLITGLQGRYDLSRVVRNVEHPSDREPEGDFIRRHAPAILKGLGLRQLLTPGTGSPQYAFNTMTRGVTRGDVPGQNSAPGTESWQRSRQFVMDHLKTLAMVKAMADATEIQENGRTYSIKAGINTGNVAQEMRQFTETGTALNNLSFVTLPNGPVVPREWNSSQPQYQEARKELVQFYNEQRQLASQTIENARKAEYQALGAEKEKLLKEIAEAQLAIAEVKEVGQHLQNEHGTRAQLNELKNTLKRNAEAMLDKAEQEINLNQTTLRHLTGLFSFPERRRLEAAIRQSEQEIVAGKKQLEIVEAQIQTYEGIMNKIQKHRANNISQYGLETKIRQAQERIQQIDNRLAQQSK